MSVVVDRGEGIRTGERAVVNETVFSDNERDLVNANRLGVVGNDETSIVDDEDSLVVDGCEPGGVSKDKIDDDELLVSRTT